MRITQSSFVAGCLDPNLAGRTDLAKYFQAAAELRNFVVQRHGGLAKRPGTDYLAEIPAAAWLEGFRMIPFVYDADNGYALVFGHETMLVVKDGALVTTAAGAVYQVATPYAGVDVGALSFVQSGDTLFLAHTGYPPEKVVRYADDDWRFEVIDWDSAAAAPTTIGAEYSYTAATPKRAIRYKAAYVDEDGVESLCSAEASAMVDYSWRAGEIVLVGQEPLTNRGAAVLYWTASSLGSSTYYLSIPTDSISRVKAGMRPKALWYIRTGDNSANPIEECASPADLPGTTAPCWAWGHVTGTTDRIYVRTEGTQDPDAFDGVIFGEWNAGDLPKLAVYKNSRGSWGRIGTTDTGIVIDDNIEADMQDAPVDVKTPFDGAGDYPGVVSLYQQRSVWARSANNPHRVWFSRTGDLANMGTCFPLKPDDAIQATIPALRSSEIRHLVSLRRLLIFSAEAEWQVGGAADGSVSPTTIRFDPQSYTGIGAVAPLVAGTSVLFVSKDGRAVHEYRYSLADDGFAAAERSILSAHLLENRRIVAWAYQQRPNSVVWAVLSDGGLLSLTYFPEHEIWAWSEHSTAGGAFRDVVATGLQLSDANGDPIGCDEIIFLVERGPADLSEPHLYVERLRPFLASGEDLGIEDAVGMDCMTRVDPVHETIATPIVDGAVRIVDCRTGDVYLATKSAGVDLARPAAMPGGALVGVPIAAAMKTVRLEIAQQPLQFIRKSINAATLRLRRSAGGTVGPSERVDGAPAMYSMIRDLAPQITAGAGDDAFVTLRDGDREITLMGDYNTDGQLRIDHAEVWPFHLLTLCWDVEVENVRP